ncbi:MAG TPA: site-specific integrase [Gaiellaceae bacterium]|nr:site-specific integrase [Gaiellaceae bacterium]
MKVKRLKRHRPQGVVLPGDALQVGLASGQCPCHAPERPLFPWLHTMQHPIQAANKTMRTACSVAGIPHYHPHDLRHRRLSLWHGQGTPAREIGNRAGQRQIAVTLDVYTHTMPLDEVSAERFLSLLD